MVKGQTKRILLAGLMASVMVLCAELLHEKEIIFPEIVALLVGAWMSPRQPWRVSQPLFVGMMGISAVAGVCIVRYLPFPMLAQAGIAFLFVILALSLTQCTLVPMISACILPILLRTTSWIYPISVVVMSAVIAAVRYYFVRAGLIEPPLPYSFPSRGDWKNRNWKKAFLKWGMLLGVFLLVAALPMMTGELYFIAPPLLVAFVEFSNPEFALQSNPLKTWGVLFLAALAGTASRVLLGGLLGLPLTVCAGVSFVLLLLLFQRSEILFPPVGALGFLPLILPLEGLWRYPLEAAAGAAVFITLSCLLFRKTEPKACFVETRGESQQTGIARPLEQDMERAGSKP